MNSTEYLEPEIEELNVSIDSIICTSPGIDPGGSGQDFEWGN